MRLRLWTPLLLCLALALASCKSRTESNTAAVGDGRAVNSGSAGGAASALPAPATADSPVAGSPVSPGDDPRQVLVKSMRALLAVKSFRARMETTAAGGRVLVTMEYVAPDRYHMKTDTSEVIIIGQDAYQNEGGSWQRMQGDVGSFVASFRDPRMVDEISRSAEVKFLGEETLDGERVLVYQYTIDSIQGRPVKSTSRTWIGAGDALPRKVDGEAEFNSMKSRTVGTYSDFGADIRIEPPAVQ